MKGVAQSRTTVPHSPSSTAHRIELTPRHAALGPLPPSLNSYPTTPLHNLQSCRDTHLHVPWAFAHALPESGVPFPPSPPPAAQTSCLLQEAFRDFLSTGRVRASLLCPHALSPSPWTPGRILEIVSPHLPSPHFTDGETEAQARDSSSPGMYLNLGTSAASSPTGSFSPGAELSLFSPCLSSPHPLARSYLRTGLHLPLCAPTPVPSLRPGA